MLNLHGVSVAGLDLLIILYNLYGVLEMLVLITISVAIETDDMIMPHTEQVISNKNSAKSCCRCSTLSIVLLLCAPEEAGLPSASPVHQARTVSTLPVQIIDRAYRSRSMLKSRWSFQRYAAD